MGATTRPTRWSTSTVRSRAVRRPPSCASATSSSSPAAPSAARRRGLSGLEALCRHALHREFAEVDSALPLAAQLVEMTRCFARRHAHTVAQWLRVGYVQGNMNSDNCLLSGRTMDYGPFGFLERYEPVWSPFTSDMERKFGFERQPVAAQARHVINKQVRNGRVTSGMRPRARCQDCNHSRPLGGADHVDDSPDDSADDSLVDSPVDSPVDYRSLAQINLMTLARALVPLVHKPEAEPAAHLAQMQAIVQEEYPRLLKRELSEMRRSKLGLRTWSAEDESQLWPELTGLMESSGADYTLVFRQLAQADLAALAAAAGIGVADAGCEAQLDVLYAALEPSFYRRDLSAEKRKAWRRWLGSYAQRLAADGREAAERRAEMLQVRSRSLSVPHRSLTAPSPLPHRSLTAPSSFLTAPSAEPTPSDAMGGLLSAGAAFGRRRRPSTSQGNGCSWRPTLLRRRATWVWCTSWRACSSGHLTSTPTSRPSTTGGRQHRCRARPVSPTSADPHKPRIYSTRLLRAYAKQVGRGRR